MSAAEGTDGPSTSTSGAGYGSGPSRGAPSSRHSVSRNLRRPPGPRLQARVPTPVTTPRLHTTPDGTRTVARPNTLTPRPGLPSVVSCRPRYVTTETGTEGVVTEDCTGGTICVLWSDGRVPRQSQRTLVPVLPHSPSPYPSPPPSIRHRAPDREWFQVFSVHEDVAGGVGVPGRGPVDLDGLVPGPVQPTGLPTPTPPPSRLVPSRGP